MRVASIFSSSWGKWAYFTKCPTIPLCTKPFVGEVASRASKHIPNIILYQTIVVVFNHKHDLPFLKSCHWTLLTAKLFCRLQPRVALLVQKVIPTSNTPWGTQILSWKRKDGYKRHLNIGISNGGVKVQWVHQYLWLSLCENLTPPVWCFMSNVRA